MRYTQSRLAGKTIQLTTAEARETLRPNSRVDSQTGWRWALGFMRRAWLLVCSRTSWRVGLALFPTAKPLIFATPPRQSSFAPPIVYPLFLSLSLCSDLTSQFPSLPLSLKAGPGASQHRLARRREEGHMMTAAMMGASCRHDKPPRTVACARTSR